MRGIAWALLLVLAFSIPWEYSLDFGPPLGNVSRLVGLAVLLALIPALLHAGHMRRPGPLLWLTIPLLLWFGFSCFWSIDPEESVRHLRGTAQELMIVWFVWELVETPEDLRNVLRAYIAGAWVLAILTLGDFLFASSAAQIRFVAEGQDPNDVARYLVLSLPPAALLVGARGRWPGKLLAVGYLPLGFLGVLLTASRSGFLAALIALGGCAVLVFQAHRRAFTYGLYALPALLAALWFTIPPQTFERIASITSELQGGDLNQRSNIWAAGWLAFTHAPFLGSGAGSFVAAAGLAPIDTAHNTALAYAVEGGIIALSLAVAIVAVTAAGIARLRGPLRVAFASSVAACLLGSLVATVQENRTTWLLLSLIAATARLAAEEPIELARTFPGHAHHALLRLVAEPGGQP